MKALIALAVTASAAAAGLSAAVASTAEEVVVTREAQGLASGCSPREVAALVNRFFDAFNRGDAAALEEIWTTEDSPGRPIEPAGRQFRWYSVTEGGSVVRAPWRHRSVYDRPELLPYFAERHRQNERMQLVALSVRKSREPWAAGITFSVRRDADDLPARLGGRRRIAGGKGGIDCERRQIYLWSMGMDMAAAGQDYPGSGPRLPCPRPPGWSPGRPIVACSTGTNARAVSNDFVTGHESTSGPCGTRAVSFRVTRALSAFNAGLGNVFARQLTRTAAFRAQRGPLRTRRAITRYAQARYHAGEGWTATQLARIGRTARFRLSVAVVHQTRPIARGRVLLTVNCHSGLISSWLGPGIQTPT